MRTLARSIWSKLVRSSKPHDTLRPHASTLCDLAGTPNAIVARQTVRTRRGTFLVLVVGTLALLSVIAIVYVTIGTQDTRVQTAAVRREKVEDVPQRVGDYLANVIAQDRLATFYDTSTITGGNGLPVMMREISDYPSTDLLVRSDNSNPHASWRFDPAGRIDTQFWFGPATAARDAVPPSDPWLATTEPTWIGIDPADPAQLADPTDVTRLYRDMKDWGHISNFAPNGRFVNLFNLRPVADGGGGFNARPGVNAREMSSGLTLIDANGEATTQTLFGEAADPDVPALWTANQRGAARPAAFVPYGAAAGLSVEDPSNSNFKLYQWADADGDGILDSRWFELIDDRNGFTNLLGDTGRYRYFIAARAVDLSARVNVNVATDFRSAARQDAPAGITPGDVDLLRILALTDSFDFNAPTTGNDLLGGYDNFRNPPSAIDPNRLLAGNYAPAPGGGNQLVYPPTSLDTGYGRNRALQVANFAYASLRLSTAAGFPFGPTTLDGTVSLQGDDLLTTAPTDLNLAAPTWDTSDPALGAERRRRLYQRVASGGVGVSDTAGGWNSTVRFATPDLAELLTRNTVNDPDTVSTLELVLGGRDDTTNTPGPGSARYSPLRDNRDLKLELASIPDAAYDVPIPTFDSGGAAGINTPLQAFEARYLMQMQTDARQRLTTLSGSVPLRPVRGVQINALSTTELPTDIGAILDPGYDLFETISQVTQGVPPNAVTPVIKIDSSEAKSIFRAYADQLLPFSGVTLNGVNAWDVGSREPGELQTTAYGYRGPEVALYAAAHLTANFIDMADRERMTKNNNNTAAIERFDDDYELNIPSVFTLIVRSGRANYEPFDANNNDFYIADQFSAGGDIRDLDLNNVTFTARLPELGDGNATTVTPDDQAAVNIFGIEAQPFLTRVSVFTTYIAQDVALQGPVEFDASMRSTNNDFAFRVVAWQLTNPFNVPVVLWDNSTEGLAPNQAETPKSRYYIEMDGRTYLIRPLNDNGQITAEAPASNPAFPQSDRNIVIYPHRSIVLYTLSQTPEQIATRITNGNTPAFTATEVRRAVEGTMGEVSLNDPGDAGFVVANPQNYHPDTTAFQAMYYIGAVSPSAANPRDEVAPASVTFNTLITTDRPESRLWRRVRTQSPLNFGGGGLGGGAVVEFDQLLDRLRVPDGDGDPAVATDPDVYPVLNRRLGDPRFDENGATPGTDNITVDGVVTSGGTGPSDARHDFLRPVITLWATVRRPANPGEPPMGALPAYCLEPKGSSRWNVFNNDRIDIASGSWDPVNASMPRTNTSLEADVFRDDRSGRSGTDGNSAYQEFSDWRSSVLAAGFVYRPNDQRPAAANEDNAPPMLNVVPNLWGTTAFNPSLRTIVGNSDRPSPSTSVSNANRYNPLLPQTRYYNQWYPHVALNNSFFTAPNVPAAGNPTVAARSIRVADMLLPLAVGPMMNPGFAPDDSSDSGETQALSGREWTNMELRWTTLGEAMAIALGYQPTVTAANTDTLSPSDIASLVNPFSVIAPPAVRQTYITRPLFDRGQLRLDEFVLFRDLDENGLFTYASESDTDVRLFTEMPAALGILDSFTVAPVGTSRAQGGFGSFFVGFPAERDAADLTRPIPGLININTASPTVLRALPGLAPWEDAAQLNEVQRITIGSVTTPAEGSFRLAFNGNQATSTIEVSSVASAFRAYLEGIQGIGAGNVKVTMVTLNPPTFDVEFIGALAATDVDAISVATGPSRGGITITTTQVAAPPTIGPVWANGSVLDRDVDLAAVVVATRDKARQFLRPQSSVSEFTVNQAGLAPAAVRDNFDPGAAGGFAIEQLSLFDREPGAAGFVAARDIFWPQGFNTNQIQTWLENREGRRAATEIRGISEREGFSTLGIVQAAASLRDGSPATDRLTGLNTATGAIQDVAALPISIDFMGYKTTPVTSGVLDAANQDILYGQNLRAHQDTSQAGLSSSFLATEWITSGDRATRARVTTDSVPGDYAEKLTPIAAISNIATTRSDYFAVWFVIHGYTEEDVTGLAPTDPMIPSVARRFLMVLDRSNVVSQGQRPKVVLFREVPYTP